MRLINKTHETTMKLNSFSASLFALIIFLASVMQANAQRQCIYSTEIEEAANQGDAEAQYILGRSLMNGTGTDANIDLGIEWTKRSAEAGCPMAIYQLGYCFQSGLGVAKDEVQSKELFSKALDELVAQAQEGNTLAMTCAGRAYDAGYGVTEDKALATEWYRKAAEAGDGEAMWRYGYKYETGVGVEKDIITAAEWYIKSIRTGNPVASFRLGLCFYYGQEAAAGLFRKAAEAGNANAMCNLGYCYFKGEGVAKDIDEANKWYAKGAEAGDAQAMNNLGYDYDEGIGLTKNRTKALELYNKAAELGNSSAMNNLGAYYNNIKHDYEKAIYWFKKALEVSPDDELVKNCLQNSERNLRNNKRISRTSTTSSKRKTK